MNNKVHQKTQKKGTLDEEVEGKEGKGVNEWIRSVETSV